MVVEIDNRQSIATIDRKALADIARRLAMLSGAEPGSVALILLDSDGMARINESVVGHLGPTDVITLFYDAVPGDPCGSSADIILNVQYALEQRQEDPSRELAYYLAHAFNHLSGRDDNTPAKRTAMHRRERRWLSAIATEVPALALSRRAGRRSARRRLKA